MNIIKRNLIKLLRIPTQDSLRFHFNNCKPRYKSFLLFTYTQTPILQLIVILMGSFISYFSIYSSSSLSYILQFSYLSFYLALVITCLSLFIKQIEGILCFILISIIGILVVYFDLTIGILYFVSIIIYGFLVYKTGILETSFETRLLINRLYMKTMFVSGFYNRFAKIQLLLVLAFNSLVPSDLESGPLLWYSLFHVYWNFLTRYVGIFFGDVISEENSSDSPISFNLSKIQETLIIILSLGIGLLFVGYVVSSYDYVDVISNSNKIWHSSISESITRYYQNLAGFDYNFTNIIGRDIADTVRNSPGFEKFLINSKGMLCSEYPIGSEGRIIDVGKTDQCLTENSIKVIVNKFNVKIFVKNVL